MDSLVAISGLKKVSNIRAHPFQWPSKWICPHHNHCVLRHLNNRYITLVEEYNRLRDAIGLLITHIGLQIVGPLTSGIYVPASW
jgi:hypothetical protein